MPGTSPACAIWRRHRRHSPKSRYTERVRPQRRQRVYARTLNFGFRCCFWMSAFFAIDHPWPSRRNGKPSARKSARPWSSVSAVVTIVMFIPRTESIRS